MLEKFALFLKNISYIHIMGLECSGLKVLREITNFKQQKLVILLGIRNRELNGDDQVADTGD